MGDELFFFSFIYNRKYHIIESFEHSFSKFAPSSFQVKAFDPLPSIVERARNPLTWKDGVICIKIYKSLLL